MAMARRPGSVADVEVEMIRIPILDRTLGGHHRRSNHRRWRGWIQNYYFGARRARIVVYCKPTHGSALHGTRNAAKHPRRAATSVSSSSSSRGSNDDGDDVIQRTLVLKQGDGDDEESGEESRSPHHT